MRSWWSAVFMVTLLAAMVAAARPGAAKPEYTRRTQKECAFCHPPGGYTLNDAGKYYRDHRTLEGYKPKPTN
jgi:hypothetical protein